MQVEVDKQKEHPYIKFEHKVQEEFRSRFPLLHFVQTEEEEHSWQKGIKEHEEQIAPPPSKK